MSLLIYHALLHMLQPFTSALIVLLKKERGQRSGINTIKYNTRPRIPHAKVTEVQINITNKIQEVYPPAGDHKAAIYRRISMTNT